MKKNLKASIVSTFRDNTSWKIFFITVLVSGLAYGLQKGVIDNYLAEVVTMSELDRGLTEFFREMPGLILVLILAVLYTFSAEAIYKLGAVIMLVGMIALSVVTASKGLIVLAMFLYSLGEHIQLGVKNSMTLEYALPDRGGTGLGYQNAISQIGTLAGYLAVIAFFAIFGDSGNYKPFFIVSAAILAVGMILTFLIKGQSSTDKNKRRFYFRKKFFKYYMLEIFYGARKQVFFTFGPYVLILKYGASATVISLLFALSAIACYFLAPVVGKIIDKLGYKIVMISDTLILVIVCFFYGFAHHIFPEKVAFVICCFNYILDSVISLAAMASNVYVQDISDSPEETRATISTGVSVNHGITILIALFGGWIWQTLGIETLFILSAILGLCNSAYAATIKTSEKTA